MAKRYSKKNRKEWLREPKLENWLIEKKNCQGESVPQCKFCQCLITSTSLSDLKGHTKTKKHKINAEPFSATRQPIDLLPFQPLINKAIFIAEHTAEDELSHCLSNYYSKLLPYLHNQL